MSYSVFITRTAQKEISIIPREIAIKIKGKINELKDNPRLKGAIKLKYRDGWRLRVGQYRVIYDIDDRTKEILILHIGHRKDIYNQS